MELLEQIRGSLQQGDRDRVAELTGRALAEGVSVNEVLDPELFGET